jgi:hypothetical protein
MSNENKIKGFVAKAPREKAPEFVKSCVTIYRLELIEYLKSRSEDIINIDIVKGGIDGKYFAKENTFKINK